MRGRDLRCHDGEDVDLKSARLLGASLPLGWRKSPAEIRAQIEGALVLLPERLWLCEALAAHCGEVVHGPQSWAARCYLAKLVNPDAEDDCDWALMHWSERMRQPPTAEHEILMRRALAELTDR